MRLPASRKPERKSQPCSFCGTPSSEKATQDYHLNREMRIATLAQGSSSVDAHILVAHHEPDTMKMIAAMFHKLGYRNVTAVHSSEARQHLYKNPCDLLFTDLDMPDPDGYLLAGCLKNHYPQAMALVMTACCQAEIVELMTDDTVDRWLYKPFSANALFAILNGIGMGTGRKRNFSYVRQGYPNGMTFDTPIHK